MNSEIHPNVMIMYRWFDTNKNSVTYGTWSGWTRIDTVSKLSEIRHYIENGKSYQIKHLRLEMVEGYASDPLLNAVT